MRILALSTLRAFWEQAKYKNSEHALKAWYDEAKYANWQSPQDVKDKFRNASFIADNRVVFNIHGNNYLLIVALKYEFGVGYVRFIGTHKQYDAIDAKTI